MVAIQFQKVSSSVYLEDHVVAEEWKLCSMANGGGCATAAGAAPRPAFSADNLSLLTGNPRL